MVGRRSDGSAGTGPILVAVDVATDSTAAGRMAADLALTLGRPLLLFSALSPQADNLAARLDERTDELERLASLLRAHHGVEAQVMTRLADDPAVAIVAAARDRDAALLVLATHGRRGVARWLQGSVAERVARTATTPVVSLRLRSA